MSPSLLATASILTALASIAGAQQSAWGQCGGIGWTGATACASGYYCSVQNSYYSQCIPGAASTTLATSTKPTATAKPTTSSAAPTSAPTPSGIKYLISFGDSYSQTGYTTSGTQPSAQNPLGNPPFPGYTTDNGPNWLGYYLTQYNKSVIYSYNFAAGGATTDASLATPYQPTVLSFIDQTAQFSSSVAKKPSYAPWTSSNALFAVWMGVNDVGMDWSMSNWSSLVEQIMTRYFQQVQIMYNAGGRKFLFLTVPPTQRTPTMAQYGDPTDSNLKAAIGQYNDALKSHAASFKAANSGVTTYILDTTTPFNTALDSPTAYGSPDNTCFDSSGTKCLWWDNYHPGQAIQKLVAQAMANLLGNW